MIKSPIIHRVLSILGGAGFLPSTVLTMGWVRSCCSHLQVGSMRGQPLWLRKTKVQHAPSLPFAYGFFQVIWQISQYVMICFVFILDTEITQKKWGGNSAWTKAPFSIRRRSEDRRSHEIPGRWLFGVAVSEGLGAAVFSTGRPVAPGAANSCALL